MFGEYRGRLMRKFLVDKEATPTDRSCPYEPRGGDVIICGYYRSGTTWLQQILHQIRTGGVGDESYDDIDRVVWYIPPFMERLDFDLNAGQRIWPRLLKCHDCYEDAPKTPYADVNVKYVVVARDPFDVAWSEKKFYNRRLGVDKDYDYVTSTTELDAVDDYRRQQIEKHLLPRPVYYPTYWEHLLSWWPHRNRPNVLWLHYEDLLTDLKACIVELARFMDIDLSAEQRRSVYEFSTFDYMRTNAEKFAGQYLVNLQCRMLAVDPWRPLVGGVRVDGGVCGQGASNFNEQTKATIRWNWRHSIENLTGFKSYNQLWTANSILAHSKPRPASDQKKTQDQTPSTNQLLK